MKAKMEDDPHALALGLRTRFINIIPTTWADIRSRDRRFNVLSAYGVAKIIQQSGKCKFDEASAITFRVFPELFAEYWEDLPEE